MYEVFESIHQSCLHESINCALLIFPKNRSRMVHPSGNFALLIFPKNRSRMVHPSGNCALLIFPKNRSRMVHPSGNCALLIFPTEMVHSSTNGNLEWKIVYLPLVIRFYLPILLNIMIISKSNMKIIKFGSNDNFNAILTNYLIFLICNMGYDSC